MTKGGWTGKQRAVLLAMAAACLVALVAVAALLLGGGKAPAFTPPPFESAAVAGTPAVDEALGWSELAVREDYRVSVCGMLTADADGGVAVWFASAESNAVWVKLRVLDAEGNLLGETGLLRPGEYVERVMLSTVPQDGTNVVLRVMAYEPETYYSAGEASLETVLRVP